MRRRLFLVSLYFFFWPVQQKKKFFFVGLESCYSDHAKNIPPAPMYYDKFSSFRTRAFPDECPKLQQAIQAQLELMGCDVERATNWQTEGVFYRNHSMIRYCVNIFHGFLGDENDCCWLVEIQRRSGDAFLFSNFFRDLFRRLSREVVNEPGCVGGNMNFMDDPMSDDQNHMWQGGDDSIVLSKEATTAVLNMARNSSLESQVEKKNRCVTCCVCVCARTIFDFFIA